MRNHNPTARGIRTALIALVCMAIVSKFNLIGRTENTIATMQQAADNIHAYHQDRQ